MHRNLPRVDSTEWRPAHNTTESEANTDCLASEANATVVSAVSDCCRTVSSRVGRGSHCSR